VNCWRSGRQALAVRRGCGGVPFPPLADQAQALERDAGQIDGLYLNVNPVNGRCVKNYRLDVVDVRDGDGDGDGDGAFLGAVLPNWMYE